MIGSSLCRANRRARSAAALGVWLCAVAAGCSRWHYVARADRDTYSIIESHSKLHDLSAPTDVTVLPARQSRLFDPTPVDAPLLPDPLPRLHSYAIPPGIGESREPADEMPPAISLSNSATELRPGGAGRSAGHPATRGNGDEWPILLARLRAQQQAGERSDELDISPVTIPLSAWESIPAQCRIRMFEFDSVRREYENSQGVPPPASERDVAPRLSFDDIVDLALLNSREYQAQKEQLYRVALRLSFEDYQYQLKFAPFGNRTGALLASQDASSNALNLLNVPSRAQLEVMLGTGTGLVTRFANDVLLTFNGPDGFTADISSELLFELTHSVFQRDIRFEPLTQAERNVLYAARRFARFRRTFYLQLAVQYYNLLRTYRQVEIDAQNYLSLVRVYGQRNVEFGQGEVARVQLDQVEQNALSARSNLIGTCNNLANALDQLKIRMGLPTETPINIHLMELDSLTLGDEVLVRLELVRRVVERVTAELAREDRDQAAALNQSAQLVARLQEVLAVRQRARAARPSTDTTEDRSPPSHPEEPEPSDGYFPHLVHLQPWLEVSELRVLADRAAMQLREARADQTAPAIRTPELALEFARSVITLLQGERSLAMALGAVPNQRAPIEQDRVALAEQVKKYETLIGNVLEEVQLDRLEELNRRADALAETATQAARQARAVNVTRTKELDLDFDDSTEATLERLLNESRRLLTESGDGLPPIDLDMDTASLSALVRRLDLANARGDLFDEWRGSKLAADDLKSVLNLQARERLFTLNQSNRSFELDFDQSRTELAVTLDTPLNRRRQRNGFREQLLNYQFARRDLMAMEDEIKQDIRAELRSIRLSREQHALSIASAALAYERVISTELQLRLGVPGVAARDYLEAQTAYANSLSSVAARHISYILGRITLITDLEQLQLDSSGRWVALHDPAWIPNLNIDDAMSPSYGDLARGIHYSKELRRRVEEFWRFEDTAGLTDESPVSSPNGSGATR